MMRALLLAGLLSVLADPAASESQQVLFGYPPGSVVVGDPVACHLTVEYEAKEGMLHFRPTIPVNADCQITPLMMQVGLYQALDRYRDADLKLIFLGRLESYHWLSDALLQRARYGSAGPGFWDETSGHPADGSSDNQYVAAVLYGQIASTCPSDICGGPMLEGAEAALSEHGYRLTGVSAEKVLLRQLPPTGGVEWSPGGKFPYDALVHLSIVKTP